MKAKEFIPPSKPRNPVVRQQQTSGAGAHRDKKKEQKQGYEKHKGKVDERVRDPEDWDEGNTEPPNNFAIEINGRPWKVFRGHGYYADDEREMAQFYKLKDWVRRKSQETGKKWEVFRTGEPATESIAEDTDIPFNQCPHCSGPIFHESLMNEKQDACYHKVRSRYKVWPSAYASGALVQCRKKGAKNWGNKGKK